MINVLKMLKILRGLIFPLFKNSFLLFSIIMSVWACQTPLKEENNSKRVFRISDYAAKFKFHNLTEFKTDTPRMKYDGLIKFEPSDLVNIFQDSSKYNRYGVYFFYSDFSDSLKMTVLEYNEDSSSDIIWFLKYDKKGRLICKEFLAMDGGDGGDFWSAYGKFVNDKFIQTYLYGYNPLGGDVDDSIRDSTIIKFTFPFNGKMERDTLFHKHEILKN